MSTLTPPKARSKPRTLSAIDKELDALKLEKGYLIGMDDLKHDRTISHEIVMQMVKARLRLK